MFRKELECDNLSRSLGSSNSVKIFTGSRAAAKGIGFAKDEPSTAIRPNRPGRKMFFENSGNLQSFTMKSVIVQ
jgi:hypothetical protein